jgi:ribosomal protein S24E
MELKIVNKKEEPLLSRTRVEAEMTFEKATPSREEIKSRLVKELGKDEKLIVVKGIHTYLGSKKAKNLSYVYENEESLKSIEPRVKKKTGKKKEESKPEAKPEQKEAVKEKGK